MKVVYAYNIRGGAGRREYRSLPGRRIPAVLHTTPSGGEEAGLFDRFAGASRSSKTSVMQLLLLLACLGPSKQSDAVPLPGGSLPASASRYQGIRPGAVRPCQCQVGGGRRRPESWASSIDVGLPGLYQKEFDSLIQKSQRENKRHLL